MCVYKSCHTSVPLGTDYFSSEEYRCTHVDPVWQEFEYYIDVCRVTRGAHIERL
jgi:hypothetical protein